MAPSLQEQRSLCPPHSPAWPVLALAAATSVVVTPEDPQSPFRITVTGGDGGVRKEVDRKELAVFHVSMKVEL